MDFEALRHGNFASLSVAIDDWSSVVKRLTTMAEDARDDLMAKANRANWAGVNAPSPVSSLARLRENSQTPSVRPPLFETSSGILVAN
jgi:hypothetical protein